MHSFLSQNGFDSKILINSTQEELIDVIRSFKNSLTEDTVSLIYFSGHGLQDEKYNYLVASDSHIRYTEDIKYNCVAIDDLLITTTETSLHLVILDACRNNPFYSGRKGNSLGLLKMSAPAGTLIAFSTSPNSVSIEREGERNGIYTKNLLKNLRVPDLPVELAFKRTRSDVIANTSSKQIPWEESSLYGENFFFVRQQQETLNQTIIDLVGENKDVSLLDLMPFLKEENFVSASVEELIELFTVIKIILSYEEEEFKSTTVDSEYLTNQLIDNYFPKLQERLVKDDNAEETFEIDFFNKLTFDQNINFGYNSLEIVEETFPQMMINFVTFRSFKGILSFYLSVNNEQYFLKPFLIQIEDNQIKTTNYRTIIGEEVTKLMDTYCFIREPLEKPQRKLDLEFGFDADWEEIDLDI